MICFLPFHFFKLSMLTGKGICLGIGINVFLGLVVGISVHVGLGMDLSLDLGEATGGRGNRSSKCSPEMFCYPSAFLSLASMLNLLIARLDT